MTTSKTTLLATMALGVAGLMFSPSAKASEFNVGVGFNRPTTVVEAGYAPARYENRTERVLVVPGHYEDRTVAAVYQTRIDRFGHAVRVLIQPASCTKVWIGDQFEDRTVSVLAPTEYITDEAPIVTTYGRYDGYRPYYGGVSFGFGFSHDRDHRDYGHFNGRGNVRDTGHSNVGGGRTNVGVINHDAGHAGRR